MNRNHEIAAQFDEIADRQVLLGESWFKIRAYRQAAQLMKETDEDVAALSAAERLGSLPGIGDAIKEKTAEYLATGHISLLDRLRGQTSDGQLALLRAGLTRAQLRELRDKLGAESPGAVREALARDASRVSAKTLAALQSDLAGDGSTEQYC